MAEAGSDHSLRGICKYEDSLPADEADGHFQALFRNGQLCLTIDPEVAGATRA